MVLGTDAESCCGGGFIECLGQGELVPGKAKTLNRGGREEEKNGRPGNGAEPHLSRY